MDKKTLVIMTNGYRVLCRGVECTLHFKEFEECLWCNHYFSEVTLLKSDKTDEYEFCIFFGTEQIR